MFVGLHMIMADRTNTPEIVITPDEGKAFMVAAQNVMRHYSVETTQKTLDWIAFAGCTAGIYMPRIAAASIRRRSNAQPATVRRSAGPQKPQPGAGHAEVSQIVPDAFSQTGFQEAAE